MERGRVGLMSTSLLAASGEPSRARILYTRVAGVLRGAVLRLPSVARRPSLAAGTTVHTGGLSPSPPARRMLRGRARWTFKHDDQDKEPRDLCRQGSACS